jgi:hypothetical protein
MEFESEKHVVLKLAGSYVESDRKIDLKFICLYKLYLYHGSVAGPEVPIDRVISIIPVYPVYR